MQMTGCPLTHHYGHPRHIKDAVHRLTGKIGVISDIGSPAPGFTPVNILIYKSKIPKCLLRDKASLMYEQSMECAEAYCNYGGGALQDVRDKRAQPLQVKVA